MDQLLQRQQGKEAEIEHIISNYKKDGAARKTKKYFETKIAALKKAYNEYVDEDSVIRKFKPELESTHQYYKDRLKVLEVYNKNIDDMRQRLNSSSLPSTPISSASNADSAFNFELPEKSNNNNDQKTEGSSHSISFTHPTQLKKLGQQLKQQDIRMRGLYREIRTADDILESNNRSKPALRLKLKNLERMMLQIMNLHEEICMEASQEQEVNLKYFVDQHYENINNEHDRIVLSLTTLLEQEEEQAKVKPLEIRLPRVELPHFYGDYTKWMGFADTFKQLVHNNKQLTNTHKMNYLKSHVQGEAGKLISHTEPIGDNYEAAWEILEKRFNNRRLLISNLLNTLVNQPTSNTESATAIKSLHDTTTECLYAIRNAGIRIDTWSPFIIFTLLKKLDNESRRLYESSLENPREFQETTQFLKFLEKRFQSLEAIGSNKSTPTQQPRYHTQPLKHAATDQHKHNVQPLKYAFIAATQQLHICVCCQQNHKTEACRRFKSITTSERNQMVMLHNLCRNCLTKSHSTINCSTKHNCFICKGNHHTLLHVKNTDQQNSYTKLNISTADKDCDPVLLATALVNVQNIYGSFTMLRALIDPGSQATFVTEEAAQQLGLPRTKVLAEVSGISSTKGQSHQQISININPRFPSIFKIQANALVLKTITKPLPDKNILGLDSKLQKEVILADPTFDTPGPIDLLIGADIYGEILLDGIKKDPQHKCVAQKSELGWIISGRLTQNSKVSISRLKSHVTLADIDKQLKRFWEAEELHPERHRTAEEEQCEKHYEQTHKRLRNGRYEVRIPLNNDKLRSVTMGDSKARAAARLVQIEKRLLRDGGFSVQYHKFMNEYIQLNHMEMVKDDPMADVSRVYYMPHHSVIKEDSTTTKLRVVFDASCKTTTGISLNDVMYVGPTVQNTLTTILMRWKKHRYVIASDIEKMFRQINVAREDQDFQRILWRSDPREPMRSFRLKTVTYGTASATYLATKTLQQLAADEASRYPIASKIVQTDFYVDDLLTGANTITEAKIAQTELSNLLASGGFNLRKWNSNEKAILEGLPENLRETGLHKIEFNDTVKTLGLLWNSTTDTFQFKVSMPDTKPTVSKRTILSEASRLFDPLGWLAPVVIQAKILLQDLWASGVGWDDQLHSKFESRWLNYKLELPQLEKLRIHRWINYTNNAKIELHGFCDASNQAYAAVVYSKVNNKISIISAKTKVAPLGQAISLPRLELNAALLLSKLVKNVTQALDINNNVSTFFWSDSTAVLGWIKGKPQHHKTFVANRITEIQYNTNPSQWYHVVSNENPADCASRGLNPVHLLNHTIWWEGPEWLKNSTYPKTNIDPKELEEASSIERKSIKAFMTTVEKPAIEFNRYSSLQRLIRSVAYCLRFIANTKAKTKNRSQLTSEELKTALRATIKLAQKEAFEIEIRKLQTHQGLPKGSSILTLNPFIDGNDLLRVGGRLANSDLPFDEKHPIIMPKGHKLSKLLIKEAHLKTLHGGNQATLAYLRAQYWVINAQKTISNTIHNCIICTRARKCASTQLMGMLPKERVTPAPPFTNSGVDYAGPITIKLWKGRCSKTTKGYIAIFICLATKAIHLELVSDLTTDAFLAAYRRFISRRGICRKIFSDCGTNFVGAAKQLQRQEKQQEAEVKNAIAQLGTDWHFLPPGSPHFGGLWEAGVKSTKQHLRKIVGTHTLTFEEFATLLAQIEACLNSRPLAPLSNNPDQDGSLTPAHFLIGRAITASPQPDMEGIKTVTRWNLLTKLNQDFWKRWRTDYLSRLQRRPKWLQEQPNIQVGELVILKDEQLPPTHWPLARVIELHPGQDGLVRVVTLKYKNNVLKRNLTKICRLPLTNESEDHPNTHSGASEPIQSVINKNGDQIQTTTEDTKIRQDNNAQSTNDALNLRQQPQRRVKMKHLALAMLSICCLLGSAQAQIKVAPFNHPTGIYFEDLGKLEVVAMKWTLVIYYNTTSYWEEMETFRQAHAELAAACKKLPELNCNIILQQLEWQFNNLVADNHLLLTSNKERRRGKRGLGDTTGIVLGDIFGILTQREAEQYEAQFENINNNEKHLMALMKNQTSIIDNTIKLVKHNSNLTISSLNNLMKEQQRLSLEMIQLNEYRTREERVRLMLTTMIELTLILKNLEDTQQGLLDVVYYSHHSILHPSILSPSQLEEQLQFIRQHIPVSITIPGHGIQDLLHIYQSMDVRSRVTQRSVIIEIIIPLSFAQDYTLLAIIPVPDIRHNNSLSHIITSTKYLAVDNHREHFASLTTEEVNRCQNFEPTQFLCEVSPIFNALTNRSQCEVAILQRKPTLDGVCNVGVINPANHWIKLHAPNEWIFVAPNETTVDVICGSKIESHNFHGSGLVTISPGCTLRDEHLHIIAIGKASNHISKSFNKSFDAINGAINLRVFGQRIKNRTTPTQNDTLMQALDTTDLERALEEIKKKEQLPTEMNHHDIHHYTISYSTIGILVLILAIFYFKLKAQNRLQKPKALPRANLNNEA